MTESVALTEEGFALSEQIVWGIVREEIGENSINACMPHIPSNAFCVRLKDKGDLNDGPQAKTKERMCDEISPNGYDCRH
jgi:hypothetical protein